MWIICKERTPFCRQADGIQGEIFTASPVALLCQCTCVSNEPIPTYSPRWPQHQSCHSKWVTDIVKANGDTAIRGKNATQRVVLTPGVVFSATGNSLTALMERVHSDITIPPRWIFFLPMELISFRNIEKYVYLERSSLTHIQTSVFEA